MLDRHSSDLPGPSCPGRACQALWWGLVAGGCRQLNEVHYGRPERSTTTRKMCASLWLQRGGFCLQQENRRSQGKGRRTKVRMTPTIIVEKTARMMRVEARRLVQLRQLQDWTLRYSHWNASHFKCNIVRCHSIVSSPWMLRFARAKIS